MLNFQYIYENTLSNTIQASVLLLWIWDIFSTIVFLILFVFLQFKWKIKQDLHSLVYFLIIYARFIIQKEQTGPFVLFV